MQLDIYNSKGEKTGRSIEMPDDIFAAEPNDHVIYLSVKQYLAAQRQGTHKVKTRAEVKGSSKKLHKQNNHSYNVFLRVVLMHLTTIQSRGNKNSRESKRII